MDYQTHFDQLLAVQPATDLQRIAKLWGASGNMRKDASLEVIRSGLNDPKLVAAFIQRLEPAERAALSFLKMQPAGMAQASTLAVAVLSAGYILPPTTNHYETAHSVFARVLAHHGLAFSQIDRYSYSYSSAYGSDPVLITDARLLEHVPTFSGLPLNLPQHPDPTDHRIRRPAQVVLDLIGFIEALRTVGGLQVNKNQTIRVSDQRKLIKALGWTDEWETFEGLRFYQPAPALLSVLMRMNILIINSEDRVVVGTNELTALPYDQIVRAVVSVFPNITNWFEYALSYQSDSMLYAASALRIGLIGFLRRLVSVEGYVAFSDFSHAFYRCVGQDYSLMGIHPRIPRPWNIPVNPTGSKTPRSDTAAIEAAWRERQWEEWQKHEEIWLAYALASWLFFLGMAELGIEGGQISVLRLTELGRSVLEPGRVVATPTPAAGPAWVVQPNFEITAFLDQATPTQIMALERGAERVQTDVYTASYRLTRESVARWLNQGETIESLLTLLGAATPQNVVTTIREWSSQFERITLRRKITLLEYASTPARDAALGSSTIGKPLGERFILLDPHSFAPKVSATIDYAQPTPLALKASTDGLVSIARDTLDLVGRAILDRWGEARNRGWQLTAASIAAATQQGYRVEELIHTLEQRIITRTTPMLLKITLRSWGGNPPNIALGQVILLRFPDSETADAIADGKQFEGLVHERVGPVSFLIAKADVARLTQALAAIGITASPFDQ